MAAHGKTRRRITKAKVVPSNPEVSFRHEPVVRGTGFTGNPSLRREYFSSLLIPLYEAVWRVDSRGTCLEVLRTDELSSPELPEPGPGQRLRDTLPREDAREIIRQVRQSIETGTTQSGELRRGFNGTKSTWEIRVAPWSPGEALVALRDRGYLDRLQCELERSRAQLYEVAHQLHAARETEQTRIAQELHDEMGQLLTLLKMDLVRMQARLGAEDHHLQQDLAASTSHVESLLQSLRSITAELRPKILDDFGLSAAIEWQVDRFRERTGIRSTCAVPDDAPDLGPEQAGALFRIVQEALTNVARHADASTVSVTLQHNEHSIELDIVDDGQAVERRCHHSAFCQGVRGMQERALALGGEASITHGPAGGTRVRVRVPLRRRQAWRFVERRRGTDRRRS